MYENIQPILEHAFKNRSEIKVAENIESAELGREISKVDSIQP